MDTILTKFLELFKSPVNSNRETLREILESPMNRETLLGVQRIQPPKPEKIKGDLDKVISYSRTTDYEIFASEIWHEVQECIDKITDKSITSSQVDFYRGALSQTLKILRISFKARNIVQESKSATHT